MFLRQPYATCWRLFFLVSLSAALALLPLTFRSPSPFALLSSCPISSSPPPSSAAFHSSSANLPLTLRHLFANLTPISSPYSFPRLPRNATLTSSFLPNPNRYENVALRNACFLPSGSLLLLGLSSRDLAAKYLDGPNRIPSLSYLWHNLYESCGNESNDGCAGLVFAEQPPENSTWVPGNTLHFIPYSNGNTFHNFAERIWPRLAAAVLLLNESTPGLPVHHFLIHRLEKWLEQAPRLRDRDQILWQVRMLMELWPGSDLLRVEGFSNTICFETILLQMKDDDRIDHTRLGHPIFEPALRNYRVAIFRFLGLPLPQIRSPPERLRVLYYGRSDTSRRRVMNNDEVLRYLEQNITRPKMVVRSLDELLRTKQENYTFLSLVSVFSQTDILVIAHGAFTWATLFMPEGSGVVEVFGPCDFNKPRPNYSDIRNMRTWMWSIASALHLKHDISNPFRDPVPNPQRGNTTQCRDPFLGVPDFTLDPVRIAEIIYSFALPHQPGDKLTLHWLYEWGNT